jgi:hypothetical protein
MFISCDQKGLLAKVSVESYRRVTLPRYEVDAAPQEAIAAAMTENASMSAGFETMTTLFFLRPKKMRKQQTRVTVHYVRH